MKNRFSDLNNHLFAQLERLSDESLTPEQVAQEVERAKAIAGVSIQVIGAAALQLKAAELIAEHGPGIADMIPESMTRKQIEHRRPERPLSEDEAERAEANARRSARELSEEREEWARREVVQ
ncbi:hypothetical protein [Aureimonas ureilytica]|uniref:hypothetical protein n=1 Tax=Aureimonas ureilytica TaxID=401562 RepID=UPI000ACC99FB|nr:hypothetical protein [Aureimonas ureilytica]